MLRMSSDRASLTTVVAALLVAAVAVGQFADRVEVAIGNLEVVVLDRDSRPVGDLARDDFRVFVDGAERAVTHFAPCSAPPPPTAEIEASATPEPGTAEPTGSVQAAVRPGLLVIVVDNQNVAPFNRNHLLQRVAAWIGGRLRAPDRAMVVVNEKTLRVACPPTSDAAEVARVVGAELGRSTAMASIQVEQEVAESRIRDQVHNRSTGFDQAVGIARFHAIHMRDHVRRTVATLESLVAALAGVEGRRDLVYVSDGLPMVPGAEMFVLIDELWGRGRGNAAGADRIAESAEELFAELAAAANRAGVTFHSIDARGLQVASGAEASRAYDIGVTGASRVGMERLHNSQDPLLYLAASTGGVAVVDSNEFEEGLERIGDAVDRCYSLGFSLEDVTLDTPHQVRVELARPGRYELRYRGTIEPRSTDARIADRAVANLAFPVHDNALGVRLALGTPERLSRKRLRVPIRVTVPLADLVLIPDGDQLATTLRLFAVARDDEGRLSEVQSESHAVRVPTESTPLEVVLTTAAEVSRDAVAVSVGVLDENGRTTGYAVAPVPRRR